MAHFSRAKSPNGSPDDRRSAGGRFRAQGIRSSLGPVLDLSISGIAVLSTRSCENLIGSSCTIWISADRGERFEFGAQVRSSVKLGFRRHRVGLGFSELSPKQRMMLTEFGSRAGAHEFGWGKTG